MLQRFGTLAARLQIGQDARGQGQVTAHVVSQRVEHFAVFLRGLYMALAQQSAQVVEVAAQGRRWHVTRGRPVRPSGMAVPSFVSPRLCAIAARTRTETLTRSWCARATRAALRPRISTVTKSGDEVFMSRRMERNESQRSWLVKLVASRLYLHSPTHSYSSWIAVTRPIISGEKSSPRVILKQPMTC